MISKHLLSIGLMVVALVCSGSEPATAAGHKASLRVGATVMPWFKAEAIQQTRSYQVTREDLARGYTDLSAALSIHYQTNIVNGKILLQVANSGAGLVLVKQSGNVSEQLFITSLAGNPQEEQTYDLRVILAPEAVVGIYPLHLSVQTTVL